MIPWIWNVCMDIWDEMVIIAHGYGWYDWYDTDMDGRLKMKNSQLADIDGT